MVRVCLVFGLVSILTGHAVNAAGVASEPRPNLTEYKKEQAEIKAEEEAVVAKQDKMAAVDKVIALVEELKEKVLAEGAAEAKTYNDFACFCKTSQEDKAASIETGEDNEAGLSAEISALAAKRAELDEDIAKALKAIEKLEKEMKTLTAARKATNKVYLVNAADLDAAIYGLHGAIKVLKASKTEAQTAAKTVLKASLVQVQSVQETIRTAMLMADALGLINAKHKQVFAAFLQDGESQNPEVEMEDYKFHSNDIIATLEGLTTDFIKKKSEVDAEEVESVKVYDMAMQEKTSAVKAENVKLDQAKALKAEKIDAIEKANGELSIVSSTLLADKEYLASVYKMCSGKAKTWDQRSKVRQGELQALTAVMAILKGTVTNKTRAATVRLAQTGVTVQFGLHFAEDAAHDEDAMDALEAATEAIEQGSEGPVGFLQRRTVHSHQVAPGAAEAAARDAIVIMLREKGSKLKSTLLTGIANEVSKDPFAKIKTMIQELIEKLLKEAGSEADQKGFCDKEISDNKQSRDYALQEVVEANSNLAKLEADRAKFKEEFDLLSKEISDIEAAQAKAIKERAEESAENKFTIKEAEEGLAAINEAIKIMFEYYGTVKKATVDLSLAQMQNKSSNFTYYPPATAPTYDLAPDAGFDNAEAYTGSQGEATGIMGMMDVIKGDFTRTITVTKQAEAQAVADHLEFMTESGETLAEKKVAKDETKKLLDETQEDFEQATDKMNTEMEKMLASIKELMVLQVECIDTGMTYDERVANREEEIEALKKALCILDNYMAPETYDQSCDL